MYVIWLFWQLWHTLTAGSNKKFISNKGRDDGNSDRDAESKTLLLLLLLLASLKRCGLRRCCWLRCFLFCCWRSVN